jgi:hypothetical protein
MKHGDSADILRFVIAASHNLLYLEFKATNLVGPDDESGPGQMRGMHAHHDRQPTVHSG